MHRRICLADVPILVLHSVRRAEPDGLGAMTMPEASFDAMLRALQSGGYRSATCGELVAHLRDGAPLPARPVVLSFDDGYLDNFTIAAPLLRRYGFRATVFVAADFVDPRDLLRPDADRDSHPPERGYMSARELRALEASGVAEVESHGAGHARLPVGPEIEDFHRPARRCLWLERLRAPDRVPFEQEGGLDGAAPWGAPVFRSEWHGAARAFRPDPALERALIGRVAAEGGADFFGRADWRSRLEETARARRWDHPGFETDAERRARLRMDLLRARRRLEEILGRPVRQLAWPGGGSSPEGIEEALATGHRATFGTNRACAGVAPGSDAIPRSYFGQEYRGRAQAFLHALKARGVADFESRRALGGPRIWFANRAMRLLRTRQSPT